jgi:hypothetical protein
MALPLQADGIAPGGGRSKLVRSEDVRTLDGRDSTGEASFPNPTWQFELAENCEADEAQPQWMRSGTGASSLFHA